ncbi:MAG: ribokinase [Verrucomicrobiales bacterium]
MSEELPPSVAVIGSLNIDYFTRVEYLPAPGETVPSDCLELFRGGKGANQAIAVARQSCHPRFFGAVGADDEGVTYRKALKDEGIDVTGILTVPTKTGAAFITVDETGENTIVTASGANDSLSAAHLLESAPELEACQALLGQFEVPMPALVEAIRIANRSEIPVIINPSPYIPTFPWREVEVDYAIVNELEAVDLLEFSPFDEPESTVRQRLHELRINHLIVTRGSEDTSVFLHVGDSFEVPTLPVLPVDTVGAGDSFAGCFTARIASGESLDSAVRAANCAGALTTLGKGAQEPIPDRDRVNQHVEHLVNHGK